jgi:DNA-binding transcriptional LysR family regulator
MPSSSRNSAALSAQASTYTLAIRATQKPPQHLIGKRLGAIHVALYAAAESPVQSIQTLTPDTRWIAPDDALPEHLSVLWRQRHYPKVAPTYRVNSILSVMELVTLGPGVGVLPLFLAQGRCDLRQLNPTLDECQTDCWPTLNQGIYAEWPRCSAI